MVHKRFCGCKSSDYSAKVQIICPKSDFSRGRCPHFLNFFIFSDIYNYVYTIDYLFLFCEILKNHLYYLYHPYHFYCYYHPCCSHPYHIHHQMSLFASLNQLAHFTN